MSTAATEANRALRGTSLHRDAMALCGVRLQELAKAGAHDELRAHMTRTALRVLDCVAMAVRGRKPRDRLLDADEALCALRGELALAAGLELLDAEPYLVLAPRCLAELTHSRL